MGESPGSFRLEQAHDRPRYRVSVDRTIATKFSGQHQTSQGREKLRDCLAPSMFRAIAQQQPGLHDIDAVEANRFQGVLDFTLHSQIEGS